MVLYNVIISPKALSQLNSYISYLQYSLFNEQAAHSVWQDAVNTGKRLSTTAGSLKICTHPQLRKHAYHAINFQHHRYVMLYRIDGTDVYVDAIYHHLQDYESIFIKEQNLSGPTPKAGPETT